MVGNSNRLTISCGSFFCSLEDSDDPLDTMKIIIAYSCAPAAGDPPFGTELPTADTKLPSRKISLSAEQLRASVAEIPAARIFHEADSQLGRPKTNAARSALQHLRAAAAKAERRAGTTKSDIAERPYRRDLQEAVQSRRLPPSITPAMERASAAPSLRRRR